MSRFRFVSFLAVLAAWGTPAAAQWAPAPYDPSEPVIGEGFLVLHQNPDVQVFSAATKTWRTIAAPDSTIHGTGDWTVLVSDADHFIGYSARRGDTALLDPTGTLEWTMVGDDVALVVEVPLFAPAVAHGYSAVTNTWSTVVLDRVPESSDLAISSFVIGVRDGTGYHGFAARTGAWKTLPSQSGHSPIADGNVLVADLGSGLDHRYVGAFSGVRGNWAVSPEYHPDKHLLLAANVAYLRGDENSLAFPGRFRPQAYSAYEGQWTGSSLVRRMEETTFENVRDNAVVLGSAKAYVGIEAFGAEPGLWSRMSGTWSLVAHDESYVVIRDAASTELWGFSGLAGAQWTPQPIPGAPTVVGGGDHLGVFRVNDELFAFMPNKNVWAAPLTLMSSAAVTGEDAVVDAMDAFFLACSARGGEWKTGPVVPAASFSTVSGGSVVMHQQLDGDAAGALYAFDERVGQWPAPFNPGGMFILEAGRNLVLAHLLGDGDESECFGVGAWAYSVERGDWTAPGGFGQLLGVGVRDDVAWAILDSTLWAFGAPTEGQVFYDWPNGTEYHVSGAAPGMADPFVAYGVHAALGDLVWGLVAPKGAAPPYSVPGVAGDLWLNPLDVISLGYWGSIDSDGQLEQLFELSHALPPHVELVFQPLIYEVDTSTVRFGDRCSPGWFF